MSLLIAQKEIDELAEKLNGKNIEATFTERCINKIAELGTSPEFGARQLKRVIDTKIRRLFVKAIVANAAPESCVVDYVDDEFKIIS
jgi:ATP-dependent Clp protease ATP-binding subunit ClpA